MAHRTGRPRESRVDEAIAAAVYALMPEVGYAGLTMDAIAASAKVGKAAIYRRYRSKAELVFGVLVHGLEPPPFHSDVSLLDDLTHLAGTVVASMTRPLVAAAAPGMFAEVVNDDAFAQRFQETFVASEKAYLRQLVDRAMARGELRDEPDNPVDLDLLHASVVGTVFYWIFNLRQPVDDALPGRVARHTAAALRAQYGQVSAGPDLRGLGSRPPGA